MITVCSYQTIAYLCVTKANNMTNFKNAIAEAKEWKLNAYVSNNELVIKKNGGNAVIGRIDANGKILFQAAGYTTSISDVAAKVGTEVIVNGNSAGFAGTDKKTLNNIDRFGFDAIEM